MKNNALVDILINWENMPKSKKKSRIQDLESLVANRQGRKPRIIEYSLEKIKGKGIDSSLLNAKDNGAACYIREFPTKIFVLNFNEDGPTMAKYVVHEGFHAYMHDYINGKVNLSTITPIDKERLFLEEQHAEDIIKEVANNGLFLVFNTNFIEEKINFQETTLIMLEILFDSIENAYDANILLPYVLNIINQVHEMDILREMYDKQYGVKYDDVVSSAIINNNEPQTNMQKVKKVIDNRNPGLLEFFNKCKKLLIRITELESSNMFYSKDEYEKEYKNLSNQIGDLYFNYINSMANKKYKI